MYTWWERAEIVEALRKRRNIARETNQHFIVLAHELAAVDLRISAKEATSFREDDSPKGETVPGVRHRIGAGYFAPRLASIYASIAGTPYCARHAREER